MITCTIGIRPCRFGPWWFQKLLRFQATIIEFDLPLSLSEIEEGSEIVVDAEIGATPTAPAIMKTTTARIKGTKRMVQVEVEEFVLNFPRTSQMETIVRSIGLFRGKRRVMTKARFTITDDCAGDQ